MSLQFQSPATDFVRKDEDPIDDYPETASYSRGCCCCWNFKSGKSVWERISSSERESKGWWGRGVAALKKVREWSEVVAGPKWKTFIRRFNRGDGRSKVGKFQYDPWSYALNFDEGQKSEEVEEDGGFRDFSMRYAAVNAQTNEPAAVVR